jgi:uncharacterized OsmC-like protein
MKMETVKATYTTQLRTINTHVRSSVELITDAPVDNQGRGESFSPTDLVATALGSCMLTIMGIAARTHGFNIDGTRVSTTKIMKEDPRRIGEIIVELTFPKENYTDKQKAIIENITRTCPVALSLHPDLKQTVILNYPK